MDSTTELKRRACAAIDASRDKIIGLGEQIMRNPETGFREFKTEARVVETMEELGLSPSRGLAVTGAKAMLKSNNSGPTLALIGELDSLCIPDHPFADKETGAALRELSGAHTSDIRALEELPGGDLVSGDLDGGVVFWRFEGPDTEDAADSPRRGMSGRGDCAVM